MFDFQLSGNFSERKIKNAFEDEIEPHEVLLDSLARKKEEELGIPEQKFEVPLFKKIFQLSFVFCFLIILILFLKTFQFQVVEGGVFSALAEENKFIISKTQAERGVIYDKDLKQLVSNLSSFDLICYKNMLPESGEEKENVLKEVGWILGKDAKDLEKEIDVAQTSQVLISENLDHQTLILLETKIKELAGFEVKQNVVRDYLDGSVFSHLVGYTGRITSDEFKENSEIYLIDDYVGRTGLENYYEETLRKNPGEIRTERDAVGDVISQEITSQPESGDSLVLWLDSALQRKIEEELMKEYQATGAKGGVAIAMDPQTGGILSLVSLPSFDNNLFQKGADIGELQKLLADKQNLKPLFNRAVAGKYLTGSIIKPMIASAALEEKIIPADKKINCQGKIVIPNPWDPSASTTKLDWTAHGWTDMRKAIAESCNVYFYTIGGGYGNQQGLGPSKMKEYLELFGWNKKTGIDLPGEAAGFIPDKNWKKETWGTNWWDGDTYNMAIGQGFLQITPLEVTNALAAVANGGTLFKPQVVYEIVDQNKKVVEKMEPQIFKKDFIDAENLQIVREGMRQTVTGLNSPQASAPDLNYLPVAVAAKTGTAELGNDRYNNWVTVFAPYENPQIILTVLLEDIKGVQRAVIPVAKNVLEWYYSNR